MNKSDFNELLEDCISEGRRPLGLSVEALEENPNIVRIQVKTNTDICPWVADVKPEQVLKQVDKYTFWFIQFFTPRNF